MKYFISQHQHKGEKIMNALREEGWVYRKIEPDIALFDHNVNLSNPSEGRLIVKEYINQGSTIITYPHGATGSWWEDSNSHSAYNTIFADLVIGEGHKHVAEIIQPELDHYTIGWSYCPLKEFKKTQVKKILFAPIHASARTNALREEAIDINTRVYNALIPLSRDYNITVRHLNPLNTIGLRYNSRINFKAGIPDGSYNDIDNADLVIAEGTYMYLSVARGKPTIGMNQHIPIRPNHKLIEYKVNNWDKYGEYMAYPIDFDDGDLSDLIQKASKEEQIEWKKLFIGDEMNNRYLSDLLKDLRKKHLS